MSRTTQTVAPAPDKPAGLSGSLARPKPYTVASDATRVAFADGEIFRASHVSQMDADGNPLALLVYEPRGQRAQTIALPIVGYAIASGLVTADEIAALQA